MIEKLSDDSLSRSYAQTAIAFPGSALSAVNRDRLVVLGETPRVDFREIKFIKAEQEPILTKNVAWERTWATIFWKNGILTSHSWNDRWQPRTSRKGGIVYDDGYGFDLECVAKSDFQKVVDREPGLWNVRGGP